MDLKEYEPWALEIEDLVEADGCERCHDVPVTHETTGSGFPLCGGCAADAVEQFGPHAVRKIGEGSR